MFCFNVSDKQLYIDVDPVLRVFGGLMLSKMSNEVGLNVFELVSVDFKSSSEDLDVNE